MIWKSVYNFNNFSIGISEIFQHLIFELIYVKSDKNVGQHPHTGYNLQEGNISFEDLGVFFH